MKNQNGALGGELGSDDVDMFGLDEFGMPAGGDAMWGAMIGGGISTGAAIITRAVTKPTSKIHQYSEAIGLLGGAVAAGAMMAFPGTRHMGWAALATSFVTNGLRQIEASFFPAHLTIGEAQAVAAAAAASPTGTAPVAAATTSQGWGATVIDPTAVIRPYQGNGLGIHTIEPGYAVHGGGFGAPTIGPAYPVPGSIHASGGSAGFGQSRPELVGPPTLVGAGDYGMGDNPGAAQTRLLGGPSVSALGAHYGATLFGGPN